LIPDATQIIAEQPALCILHFAIFNFQSSLSE